MKFLSKEQYKGEGGGRNREEFNIPLSVVVKALRYKPQGRGFDTRWGEFLNLPNPSRSTRPWGLLSL
jgi:hypothetical protein